MIEFGGTQSGAGIAIASSTNTFDSIVSGLELTVVEASDKTISVDVTTSSKNVVDTAQDFVDAYNSVRSNLDEVTDFDAEALTTGILFGTTAALRVDSDLSHLLSGRFFGVGKYSSLEAVGITLRRQGQAVAQQDQIPSGFRRRSRRADQFLHPRHARPFRQAR